MRGRRRAFHETQVPRFRTWLSGGLAEFSRRRKSACSPVFMRVGRRFYSQLGPHLDFVSKNGSFRGTNSTVLARQGGDLSVIQDCS